MILFLLFTTPAFADNGQLSFTVAPPLFQINLQPGETWTSGITVVNNNNYDTVLYAEPFLFEPSGESGKPVFIEPSNTQSSDTLADWITVPNSGFTIPREQTYTVPISIQVPADASPGGHYAAVLIGNRAPKSAEGGSTVNVTSSIASLIILSVSGDITERGFIREFSTEELIYEDAHAKLTLRFENQGNVHLVPQGNIVIYNMFGKERGMISVNHNRDYGNVLPGSIRQYVFSWESDIGIWDIGRYKAEATVAYGRGNTQTALATTYFYILPVLPLMQVLGVLIGSILFLGWAIRVYVRRALAMETERLRMHPYISDNEQAVPRAVSIATFIKPIQVGFVDLRKASTHEADTIDLTTKAQRPQQGMAKEVAYGNQEIGGPDDFIKKYKLFFLSMFVLACAIFAISMYVNDVTTVEREYTVTEMRSDGTAVDITELDNGID